MFPFNSFFPSTAGQNQGRIGAVVLCREFPKWPKGALLCTQGRPSGGWETRPRPSECACRNESTDIVFEGASLFFRLKSEIYWF